MGACATKILTKDDGAPAPEVKPEEHERDVAVVENKVITADVVDDDSTKPKSLAQMLEDEGKAPVVTKEATKAVEEKVIESISKEETSKSVAEPVKTTETKPVEAPKKPEEIVEKIQVEEKKPLPTK